MSDRRHSVRLIATVLSVGVLILVLAASVQIVSARRHIVTGMGDLAQLSIGGNAGRFLLDPSAGRRLRLGLVRAEGEFSAARADLRLWSPILRRLGWVPRFGPEIAGAPGIADAATDATSGLLYLLDGLHPLERLVHSPHAGPINLRLLAGTLATGNQTFLRAGFELSGAQAALSEVPLNLGNPTLNSARNRFAGVLPTALSSARLLALTPSILGLGGPRHYLLTVQDPTELRATGGFIGAVNYLTVRRAHLATAPSSSILPHEISSIPAPLPEAAYTPEGPWIFRDANWSPDFPLSARLERWFYGEDTGRWADGVISMQDTVMPGILAVTGPVYLPSYRQWVNAANVQALGQHYLNSTYHGPATVGAPDTVRKQFLGSVSAAVLQRMQQLPVATWLSLGSVLGDAVSRRDIMIYAHSSAIEETLRSAGVDGSLTVPQGDFLHIVDDNRSYNKLGPYIRETASYRLSVQSDRSLACTLTLRYQVTPSPSSLEGLGPGYGAWGSKHDFQDFLRVYVPAGAHLNSMSGVQAWAPAAAYGLRQFAGRMLIRQGHARTVVFHYHLPAGTFDSSQPYRLFVRRQPGSRLSAIAVTVQTRGNQGNSSIVSTPAIHRVLPLRQDAQLGSRLPQSAADQSPSGFSSDPYVPFGEFRDARHPL